MGATWPWPVHLDRKQYLSGTYDGGSDTTEFTSAIDDPNISVAVLSSDFGANAGTILDVEVDGTTLTVDGNWAAGYVCFGVPFDYQLHLNEPYRHDQEGRAVLDDRVHVNQLTVAHFNAGPYSVRTTLPNRADRSQAFTPSGVLETHGEMRVWHNGRAQDMDTYIESDSPKPLSITTLKVRTDSVEVTN